MNTLISPAKALIHNGIAVFDDLRHLSGFTTPYQLKMTLMVVCVEGAISATIDLDVRRMKAGSIMVLRPGHILNDITKTSDFSGFFILIEEAKFAELMPMSRSAMVSCLVFFKDNSIVPIEEQDIESLRLIYTLMRQRIHRVAMPYNQMMLDSLCEVLFYETMGIYTNAMNRRTVKPTRREELLMRFIEMVETDYRRERSVAYYANRLCLSAKHLSSVVKDASGMTAGEWIDRKVIREAKLLLRNTPKTIQQIASTLNFANQSFFGKYFKNLTGMTPRQYRLNLGE